MDNMVVSWWILAFLPSVINSSIPIEVDQQSGWSVIELYVHVAVIVFIVRTIVLWIRTKVYVATYLDLYTTIITLQFHDEFPSACSSCDLWRKCFCSSNIFFISVEYRYRSWGIDIFIERSYEISVGKPFSVIHCTGQKSHYPPANHWCWWPDTLIIERAPARVIIKVMGHQHWWLAGGYALEVRHF